MSDSLVVNFLKILEEHEDEEFTAYDMLEELENRGFKLSYVDVRFFLSHLLEDENDEA